MSSGDSKTTIEELKSLLKEFRDKRDWAQFHDPKNLAEAISIEAGELQEHFLWKDIKTVGEKLKGDSNFRKEVGDELADVIIFCLNFANSVGFDVSEIVKNKINEGNKKYPVEKAKGNATKYDKL